MCYLMKTRTENGFSEIQKRENFMEKHDKYMAVEAEHAGNEHFFSADDPRFRLEGFAFRKPGEPFYRLNISENLPPGVQAYARQSASGVLCFTTDSKFIKIRARVRVINNSADIMTYGRIGFDLYRDGKYCGISRLNFDEIGYPEHTYTATLFSDGDGNTHTFRLYFPLYAEVMEFGIALSENAHCEPAPAGADQRPIVLYGTSIEHGCCASRPGLAMANQLSRKLGMPLLNFGFSGSGHGEAVVAQELAKIPDPRIYILAYDANVSPEDLEKTLPEFCRILHEAHPETPILTVSHLRIPNEDPTSEWRTRRTAAHLRTGHTFLDGLSILGDDFGECYTDRVHPNDLGMTLYADALAEKVRSLLAGK